MADAPDEWILTDGGLMGGYVCSWCGTPVESEPCQEHQKAAFLAGLLGWAEPGNRCKVPGFTDWVCNEFNGWRQDESGWMVSHGYLAVLIIDSGCQLASQSDIGAKP